MFDVNVDQALLISCCGPPSALAVQEEEASIVSEVVEEGGQGCDRMGTVTRCPH